MRDPYAPYADEQAAATPTPQIGPTEHELRRQAINNCTHCDPDGYRQPDCTSVCDHHDGHRQAAQRGMAAIRTAMGWNTNHSREAATSPSDTLPGT